VANAALVTVALAECVVLLGQFVRGPAAAKPARQVLEVVKPVAAHATVVPLSPSAAAAIAPAGAAAGPAAPRGPVGWVLIQSHVPVKVSANGKVLGTTTQARYRLPAGHHTLTIENTQRGISFTEPLDLNNGQTVLVSVTR
jgi:hypothetical protein